VAVYESKYAELAFYVDGKLRKFQYGKYQTNDPKEIEVLDKLADAVRVDAKSESEPKPAKAETESKPKTTRKK
jgi:hypothetical protein